MKDITKGNLSKNFILYAIPVIISGVLSQAYLTVDKIMVGQVLGEVGLAALGSTGSFITLMKSIIWGLGTGISLYVAFLSTGEDKKRLVNAIKVNLLAVFALAFLISAVSLALYFPIFNMLAIGEDIWHDALVYYAIYMCGFSFLTFSNAVTYIFNALGKPSFPMKVSIASSLLNILFNFIFMIFLKWGVAGAAFGTLLASLISAVIYLIQLKREVSGISKEKVPMSKRDITPAWRQGIPCMLQQFIMYVSGAAVQPAVNLLGTAAIAAYSVCSEIYSICATIFQNSSRGLSPFCAQCYGKGNPSLVKRGVGVSVRQGILLSLPIMAFFMIFPNKIADVFLGDNASEESINYVVTYILICIPFILCQIINNLFHNFYRGVMMPKIAMITTLAYSLVRVITTYALVFSLGMMGVFLGFIIPWFVECVLSIVIYLSGKWKNEAYRRNEQK